MHIKVKNKYVNLNLVKEFEIIRDGYALDDIIKIIDEEGKKGVEKFLNIKPIPKPEPKPIVVPKPVLKPKVKPHLLECIFSS